ncbi:MAG: hypothetical protein K2X66_10495, partial [Cyanobacteria bacterium]|nr:hypothetical protein [Cyanobacteriota bacterium]
HAGPAAASLKHRLGAKMTSCLIAFRHLNPLAQKVLEKLSGHLAFEHGLSLEPTVWGTLWRNSNESQIREGGADESLQHLPTAWENSACV